MIPQRYILEWQQIAPWTNDAQVEQDLVISTPTWVCHKDLFPLLE